MADRAVGRRWTKTARTPKTARATGEGRRRRRRRQIGRDAGIAATLDGRSRAVAGWRRALSPRKRDRGKTSGWNAEAKRQRGRPRAFNPSPEQTTIQALDRAVAILKVLAGGEGGMSLTELAEASGQAPATVYRVLSTFEAHGVVEVQPATQLWFVGQEAFRIGSAFLGRTSLVEQARGVMHALMAETGETANLAIADGGQVVFISQVETHEPIRAFFRPGTRGPIHASGIGKALLAYHAPEAVARIVREQGLAGLHRADDHRPGGAGGRARGDPGARLGDGRRGADRGDALHRGADLQRVPRGDRGGVDLRPDGADGAGRGRRARRQGAGGGRPDHPGDRRHGALVEPRRVRCIGAEEQGECSHDRSCPYASGRLVSSRARRLAWATGNRASRLEVAVGLRAEARRAEAVEHQVRGAGVGDALGDAGGDQHAVAGADRRGLAADLDDAMAGEDDVALDGAGDGVKPGGDAGRDAGERERGFGAFGEVERAR